MLGSDISLDVNTFEPQFLKSIAIAALTRSDNVWLGVANCLTRSRDGYFGIYQATLYLLTFWWWRHNKLWKADDDATVVLAHVKSGI